MSAFARVVGRWAIPFVLVGLGAGLVAANLRYVEAAPADNDFVARWEGARAWIRERLSPYDPQVSQRAQERVYRRPANPARGEDPEHFLYPFPAMVVLGPLGLLEFDAAQAVWMSLIEVSLLASTILWIAAAGWRGSPWLLLSSAVFSLLWFPAFAALVGGQFAAIEALLLAAALAALRGHRESLAGILFAAGLFKPQVGVGPFVYVLVWALLTRRRQFVGWLITGLVLLVGGSLILEPRWPAGFLRQVLEMVRLPVSQSPLARLSAALGTGTVGTFGFSGALLVYLLWEWKESIAGDERRFLWTLGLTHIVVVLVAPFGIAANMTVLMLPVVLILEAWHSRQGRMVEAPAAIALLVLGGLTWLVSVGGLAGGEPSLWLLVAVPLFLLLGLLWVRWWATRARIWSELGTGLS